MTSQRRKRLASGDVSDDSALESDTSSLTDGETGSDGARSPPRAQGSRGAGPRSSRRAPTGSAAPRRCSMRGDRMLMRDWLQAQADRKRFPNMHWCNAEHTMIRIPWKHGSRSGWTIEDCKLYRAWAKYTGTSNNSQLLKYGRGVVAAWLSC